MSVPTSSAARPVRRAVASRLLAVTAVVGGFLAAVVVAPSATASAAPAPAAPAPAAPTAAALSDVSAVGGSRGAVEVRWRLGGAGVTAKVCRTTAARTPADPATCHAVAELPAAAHRFVDPDGTPGATYTVIALDRSQRVLTSRTTDVTGFTTATTTAATPAARPRTTAAAATGSIAGTVRAATGGTPLAGVVVRLIDDLGALDLSTTTAANGTYTVTGVPTTARTAVCFDAAAVPGPAGGGFVDACWTNSLWDGSAGAIPDGAALVAVSAGATTSGIDAALTTGAAVSGTVTNGTTGSGDVAVNVFSGATRRLVGGGVTATNGTYTVRGLPAGSTVVCFDATVATGAAPSGYLSQCSSALPWDGGAVPSGAKSRVLTAGSLTTAVNATLSKSGAIRGTVRGGTAPLPGVRVAVVPYTGDAASTRGEPGVPRDQRTFTAADGTYTLKGLYPGRYQVCFDSSDVPTSAGATGWQSRCSGNVAWSPFQDVPATVGITTVTGTAATVVDAALPAGGAVSGKVTAATGGAAVAGVRVQAFDDRGDFTATATTSSSGTYLLSGLTPGVAEVCFTPTGPTSAVKSGFQTQCWNAKATSGDVFGPPADATPVPVTAGSTTPNVDAVLATAGSITGNVTGGGTGLAGVRVLAFDTDGGYVADTSTISGGAYRIPGLDAGTYVVCFAARGVTAGSATGWQSQCATNVPWGETDLPGGTTPVKVATGATTGSVNAALTKAGALSGRVTEAGTGRTLGGAQVSVFGPTTISAETAADGTWTARSLLPGTYRICVTPDDAVGAASTTGLVGRCRVDVPWNGGPVPSGAAAVTVAAGATVTGNDVAVTAGFAVSGRVTEVAGGTPLAAVDVVVRGIDSGSTLGVITSTAADGTFRATGLSGNFRVCFDPVRAAGGPSLTGYLAQCWNGVAWKGGYSAPPASATVISQAPGSTQTGVSAALKASGSVSGAVTAANGGKGLSHVGVYLFSTTSTAVLAQGVTALDGTYVVQGLNAGSYRVCFDPGVATGGAATSGLRAVCWSAAAWTPASGTVPASTAVAVTAGTKKSGISVALTDGGGLTGTVTAASDGTALRDATVVVFAADGTTAAYTSSGRDGSWLVTGLAAGNYRVCVGAPYVFSPTSTSTGWIDRCYGTTSWDGVTPAAGATVVAVTTGTVAAPVAVALASAGAVSGRVASYPAGVGLNDVSVQVFRGGDYLASVTTSGDGSYAVTGLTAGAVTVCFDPTNASPSSASGYLGQCWKKIAWNPSSGTIPSSATAVTVALGAISTGINGTISAAGAVSGTVTSSVDGSPVADISVTARTSTGKQLGYTATSATGTYTLPGLSSGTVYVCFDASSSSDETGAGYLSQCYRNVAWDGFSKPPTGSTTVTVTAGVVTSGIDASLQATGSIAGTARSATGSAPLDGVSVLAYSASGVEVADASTAADGTYRLGGLAPGSYRVCFDASGATGGPTPGQYAGVCYQNAAWDGFSDPPAGATAVTVTSGATTSPVDVAVPGPSGVSGTVTGTGGVTLTDVGVTLYSATGDYVDSTSTAADGTYAFSGVAAGSYRVCFDGSNAGGAAGFVYRSECYQDVAWDGFSAPPSGATAVTVTAGAVRTGVDEVLDASGAISGTARSATGSVALADVNVTAFGADDTQVASATTATNGTYRLDGLVPGVYRVCFDAFNAGGGPTPFQYTPVCYTNVAWDGFSAPPTGATAVTVSAGSTRSGVDVAVPGLGAISGKVTNGANTGLLGVYVYVYTAAGDYVNSVQTTSGGTWSVDGLTAGSYRVCFADFDSGTYAAECWNNVPWDTGGVPAGATAITVNAGAQVKSINAALARA